MTTLLARGTAIHAVVFFGFLAFSGALSGACGKDKAPAPEAQTRDPVPSVPGADAAPVPSAGGTELGYGPDALLFSDASSAIREILKEDPRVIGIGEYHKLDSSAPVDSALLRFRRDMFATLSEDSAAIVLETWQSDRSCGEKGAAVTREVERVIERPVETKNELEELLLAAKKAGVAPRILDFPCNEYNALVSDKGLDSEALLTHIATKLGEAGLAALRAIDNKAIKAGRVLIYGGSTHNDLRPYPGLEAWSYVDRVQKASQARYAEIDLYVPELVSGDPVLSKEPWYPLLAKTRPDGVILIRREPGSYILLLRKALTSSVE